MEHISAGKNVFVYPMPVALLGSHVKGKPNFMALGWFSRVNANPPLIGCGVGNHHHTTLGIRESRTFSINVPDASMIREVDYCGLVSGSNVDKSALFSVFYGETGTTPMIRECPLCLECRLVGSMQHTTNEFFVGEIVASWTSERFMTEGKLDIRKMNPLLLTMPDNRYWTVGEEVGAAWSAGRDLARDGEK